LIIRVVATRGGKVLDKIDFDSDVVPQKGDSIDLEHALNAKEMQGTVFVVDEVKWLVGPKKAPPKGDPLYSFFVELRLSQP
jgi:hypothetical protein